MESSALSSEEVERRLPTLQFIEDDQLRLDTAYASAHAPEYFWTAPATKSSNYHHPAARERRGLWVHTLMLSTVIERLSDSYVQQGRLESWEVEHAHAAAILHDQRKLGDRENPSSSATDDHDLRMAEFVRESTSIDDRIADAIATHNGPWYDGPEPEEPLERLVHHADMVASAPSISPGIQGPLPAELQSLPVEEVDLL